MLTQERLKQVLSYDAETGIFVWIKFLGGKTWIGRQAGALNLGYRRIMIDGERYLAHRLAWFWMTGEWPKYEIDHLNGLRDDNRFVNLRDVPAAENQQNVRRVPKNSVGFLGVRPHRHGRFRASIRVKQKTISLGVFDTAEEASRAYWDAKRKFHPTSFVDELMKVGV